MRNDTYHCNGVAEYDRANAGELDAQDGADERTEEEIERDEAEALAAWYAEFD